MVSANKILIKYYHIILPIRNSSLSAVKTQVHTEITLLACHEVKSVTGS